MKKQGKIIGAIALTFALGGVLILGNAALATKAVAAGFETENQTIVTTVKQETTGQAITENNGTDTIEVSTVMKTLPNGTTVIVEYFYGENGAQATITYSNDSTVHTYEGDAAEATIERFGGLKRNLPDRYVEGQPDDSDIEQEAAVSIGLNAITSKYALRQTTLDKFNITTTYYSTSEDIGGAVWSGGAVWFVRLYPINVEEFSEIGSYSAVLDATTGEVIQLLSAADGRG